MTESIEGIQELQELNDRLMAELTPRGGLGKAVHEATVLAHRYVLSIAHVDTGAMRAAQRQTYKDLTGRIYTDPSAVNPDNKALPSDYIAYEEARGGSHAVYTRTEQEALPRIGDQAISIVVKRLPL